MSTTSKPTIPELSVLSDNRLLYLLITDTGHGREYREQIRIRMTAPKNGSIFSEIDKEKYGNGNGNHHQTSPKQAARKAQPASPDKRWRTDRELAEEPNFPSALETFIENVPEYWDNRDGGKKKDAIEIEDFLQSLIDSGKDYDELTDPQQSLLGMIRRNHSDWVRDSAKV